MGFAIFMRERGTRKGVMKVGPFATKTKKEREAKREVFDLISKKKRSLAQLHKGQLVDMELR
jgi:hypothetical protein